MNVITVESAFLEMRKEQKEMMRKIDRIAYTIGISLEYEKEWLTGKEVCGMLNICYRTLHRMKLNGSIRYSVFHRRSMFHRSDIEKIIMDNRKYA